VHRLELGVAADDFFQHAQNVAIPAASLTGLAARVPEESEDDIWLGFGASCPALREPGATDSLRSRGQVIGLTPVLYGACRPSR
jgi:hypothetical protein